MKSLKTDSLVSVLLEQKKLKAKARGRKVKRLVMPRPKPIKSLERGYYVELKPILQAAKAAVERVLLPKLEQIIRIRDANRPKGDSRSVEEFLKGRLDSWVDEIESAMTKARIQFEQIFTIPILRTKANQQAIKINRANHVGFDKGFEKVLGVPPIKIEAWLQEEIKAFTKTNVELIKSIPQTYFNQVEDTVSRMVQQGKMTDDIKAEIERRYQVSESRAALIARDQTNKFNGSLTQLRQQEVGITQYEWSTSLDERVREEHADREGDVFDWNDPPEDGHPGQAINCRCSALGIISQEE